MPRFAILSAHRSGNTPEHNHARTVQLSVLLHEMGFHTLPVRGCYTHQDGTTVVEDSFLVPVPEGKESLPLLSAARRFDQESILLDTDGEGSLLFLADGHVQPLGHRTPGVSPGGYTSTILGDFHYA